MENSSCCFCFVCNLSEYVAEARRDVGGEKRVADGGRKGGRGGGLYSEGWVGERSGMATSRGKDLTSWRDVASLLSF